MKRLQVTPEQAAKIAAKLPDGKTIADIRLIRCSAKILTAEDISPEDADVQAVLASVNLSAAPPLLTNGKPTLMRIVAWMAHEGVNKNRLEFLAEDLGPAADAIRAPNLLPMDFNHSAFRPWSTDPKAVGVWYAAEKRWNPEAKNGAGAYGILTQGIMWSWLFPDYATEMLAEQERNGGELFFSMACLPSSVTLSSDENGPKEIAHQPVFLTNSMLDVPPADDDCDGIGVEGSDDPELEQTLTERLLGSATVPVPETPTQLNSHAALPKAASLAQLTEVQMEELQNQIAALTAQLAEMATSQANFATATARIAELEAELQAAKDSLVEVETARDAVTTAAETSATEMTALRAELDAAKTKLDAIAAAEALVTRTQAYETRLSALPQLYRDKLATRTAEEQERFATKWTNASDEEWKEFAGEIQLALKDVRVSYLGRSHAEGGVLPSTGSTVDDMAALVQGIKR